MKYLLYFLVFSTANIQAATYSVEISGTIVSEIGTGGAYTIGSSYSLTYRLDTSTSSSTSAFTDSTTYFGAVSQMEFSYNGTIGTVSAPIDLIIENDNAGTDIYNTQIATTGASASNFPSVPDPFPIVPGATIASPMNFGILLQDTSGTAFSNSAIPLNLSPADFDLFPSGLFITYSLAGSEVEGNITSISTTLVPEPSIPGLCLLSLAALLFRKRRS